MFFHSCVHCQTIHTYEGDFRAYKALIAAAYNGVTVTVKNVDVAAKEHQSPAFLAKNPLGKVWRQSHA